MSKLALLGGKPVAVRVFDRSDLIQRKDVERRSLLNAYNSGMWDDWPGKRSIAKQFEEEWAAFNGSKFCALLTNGTHSLQIALETLDNRKFDFFTSDHKMHQQLSWLQHCHRYNRSFTGCRNQSDNCDALQL